MSAQAILEMKLEAKQFATDMKKATKAVEEATKAVDDAQKELGQFKNRYTAAERASGELLEAQKKLEDSVRSASKAFVMQKNSLKELETRQAALAEQERRSQGTIKGMVAEYENFKKSSPKIVKAILAIVAAMTAAVAVFAEFQQAVQDLSAISGIVGKDLEFLSDSARRFGASSRFTASEAAKAYQLVASAKPDLLSNVQALEEVTKWTLKLAEATGIDLPEAAEILAASLNQFGAGADQAGRFVNVLTASVRYGSSSVTDTAEALKYAGSLAKLAGISFEEAATAIMLMAKNKLVGSQAGTALVGTLSKLEQQMRLQLKPSAMGIEAVFKLLAQEGVDVNRAMALFGQEAAKGGAALVEYAGQWKGVQNQITGTQTATEMATQRLNSIQGDWKTLISQLQELGIKAVEAFGPEVRLGLQAVIMLLKGLGVVATGVGAIWLMLKLTLQAILGGVVFLIVKIGQALTWLGEKVGIFSKGATAAVAEFADEIDGGVMLAIQDTADLMGQLGVDSEEAGKKLGGVGSGAKAAAEDLDKLGRSWKTTQIDLAREFGLKITKELQTLKVQLKWLDEGAGYVSVFSKALADNMIVTGAYEANLKKSGAAVQAFMDAIKRKTFLVEFSKEMDYSTKAIAWQLENLDKSPAVIEAVKGAIKSLISVNSDDMRAVIARTEAYERLEKFLQIAKGEDPFTKEQQRISAEIAAIGRSEAETAKLNLAKAHGLDLSEEELAILFEQIDALQQKKEVSAYEKIVEDILKQITALKISTLSIGDNGKALAKFTKLQDLDNTAKKLGVEVTEEQRDSVSRYIDTLYEVQEANEAIGEFSTVIGDAQYELSVLEYIREHNVALAEQEALRARLDAKREAGNKISESELDILESTVNSQQELNRIIEQKNAGETEQQRLELELQTLKYLRENNIALSQQSLVREQLNAVNEYGLGLSERDLELMKKTIAAVYEENQAREQLAATIDIIKGGLKTLLNDALDGNKIELDKFFEYMRNRWRETFVEMMAEKITLQIQANVQTTGVGGGAGGAGGGFSGNQAIAAFAGGAIAGSGGDTGSSNQQISGTLSGAMAGYQMSGSPYGAIIGAVVGAVASGVTTGTPWREVGREIAAQVIGGAASMQNVSLQQRDQPFYGGVSDRRRATELVGDQGYLLSEIWRGITTEFAQMADVIGLQGSQAIIDAFRGVFSVDVTGLEDDQIAAAVEAQFRSLGDLLAGQLIPLADGFRKAGESFTETLMRLFEATNVVNAGMELLSINVVDLIDPQFVVDATSGLYEAIASESADFIRTLRADIHENLFNRTIIGPDAPELMDAPELGGGSNGLGAVGDQISQLQDYITQYEEALLTIGDAAGASVVQGTDALSYADLVELIRHARERLDGLVVEYEEALAFAIMKFREGLVEAAGSPERLAELFQVYAETFMTSAEATENVLTSSIAEAQQRASEALAALGTDRSTFVADFQAAQVGGIDPAVFVQWLQASELIAELMDLEIKLANSRGEALQVGSLTVEQQLQLSRDAEGLRSSFEAMGLELGVSADAINQWVLNLSSSMGGLDGVSNAMEFVFTNFVDRQEQLGMIMADSSREIDQLGMSVSQFAVNGRETFMQLFSAAVSAGDEAAIAMLLNLAPALDAWIVAQEEMVQSIQEAAVEFSGFAARMRESFSNLGIGSSSGDIVSELGLLDQFQRIADALGGTEQAVDAFELIWDEFVSDIDKSAIAMESAMANILDLGFDPQSLIEGGREGFMELLRSAAGDVEALAQLALVAPFLATIFNSQDDVDQAVAGIETTLTRLSRSIGGLVLPEQFVSQLSDLFGSTEDTASALEFVWDNFMDDTQRTAIIVDEARRSIAAMGFDVTQMVALGRQGFIDLLSSAMGDPAAYRQLLLIAPFLDAIFDAADEAGTATDQFNNLGDAIRSAAANIQSTINSILQTPSSFASVGPTAPLLSRITSGYSKLGQGSIQQQIDNINQLNSLIKSRYDSELGQLEHLMGIEQERVNARNSALQEQYEAEQRLYEEKKQQFDALMSKASSLRKFLDSLTVGPLSGATPYEAMQAAQVDYQAILARAMAGDQEAIDQLQSVSQQYLEAARDVYATSPEYFQILDSVTASIRAVIASLESQATDPGTAPSPPELVAISENTGRMAAIQADMVAAQERAVQELEALQVELERLELERQAQEQAYKESILLANQEAAEFSKKTAEYSGITSGEIVDISQLLGGMLAQDLIRNAALFDANRQLAGLQVVYADGMQMVASSVSATGDALSGLGDTLSGAIASSMRNAADRIVGAINGLESSIEAAIESASSSEESGGSGGGESAGSGSGGGGGTGLTVRDPNPRRRVVYGR